MKLLSIFVFFVLLSFNAFGEVIQILHTNDLHSHLDHTPHKVDLGGYARLKVLMAKQRALAAEKGIGTIAMDGGDFMEGSVYYLADKGKKTFAAFGKIGYDVAVLGNHDYLMAASDLDEILRDVPPSYALLAANFKIDASYKHINDEIRPVRETVINGVKVGVIGITLNDLLYKWRLKGDGGIDSEIKTAKHYAKYLRERGNEVIIALTHIGLYKDRWPALNVPELDLIVGGHTHTKLDKVVYQKTLKGKTIPIVQAGNHGEWLGKLMIDYDKKKKSLKVLEYQLIPVKDVEKDPEMVDLIAEANEELNSAYGKDWLAEVVGKSTLRPRTDHQDDKVWHYFINDSMLEASGADFSVHTPPLSGHNYPVGEVTRRALYEGNPRTFDFADKFGYHIYTAEITGAWLKLFAKLSLKFNLPLYFSGLDFKWKKKADGDFEVWDVRHKGKKVNLFKRYKVAFCEGIVRGAYGISKWTKLLLKNGKRTEISMWEALEEKFRRETVLTPDYLERHARKTNIERLMVPASLDLH